MVWYKIMALIAVIGMIWGCKGTVKGTDYQQVQNERGNWKLVWDEEFDYTGLPDSTKWSYDTAGNAWGWGNHEAQYYTVAWPENARVEGGVLKITALKEAMGGKEYTSARLLTKGKGDWLYGRFEIRAKLPTGRGAWPAIWMLPTDWEYGGWPASGEIDIMENVGFDPDTIVASAHTQSYYHSIGTQKTPGLPVRIRIRIFTCIRSNGNRMNTGCIWTIRCSLRLKTKVVVMRCGLLTSASICC